MPDTYPNFYTLAQSETAGVDYRIHLARAAADFLVIAPHGGGIEPGTSEIAVAIAGERFSFYSFEGLKTLHNSDLHITSTRFDEPACLALIGQSDTVLTIHGESSDETGEVVFVGGADQALGADLARALRDSDFIVSPKPEHGLEGLEPCNLCNRGRTAAGVQLELSLALRNQMFEHLTREGRRRTLEPFDRFVRAVAQVLVEKQAQNNGAEPVIELDDKRIPLTIVDPVANGKKGRPRRRPDAERATAPVDFDPGRTLATDSEEEADDHLF